MYPYFPLFGINLPAYGTMSLLGGVLALVLVLRRHARFDLPRSDAFNVYALCLLGLLVGAKVLYVITQIPAIIRNWESVVAHPLDAIAHFGGGLVFYGGLLGAAGVALWYCRHYKVRFWAMADLFAPAIPAAHALGRVGCFLAGCCYGLEVPWGLTYTHSLVTEADGVPRLPVQLIEAACLLLLCLALLFFQRKPRAPGASLALYGLCYALLRFVLEFFRGDLVRGVAGGLSTSQWISLGILVLCGLWLLRGGRRFVRPAS